MGFKHNKKRNVGLVYEFLTREMSLAILDNDEKRFGNSLSIVKRHFTKGPLREEKSVFDVIMGSRGLSRELASKVLREAKRRSILLKKEDRDAAKGRLISEINKTLGMDFFDKHRIPEYRTLASISLLIDSAGIKKRIDESVELLKLDEGLLQHMMSLSEELKLETDPDVDQLVCSLVTEKFNEKYSNQLNEQQKRILGSYVTAMTSESTPNLIFSLEKERKRMLEVLSNHQEQDHDINEKITEAQQRLEKFSLEKADESVIEEMLLYSKLCEEILSDE